MVILIHFLIYYALNNQKNQLIASINSLPTTVICWLPLQTGWTQTSFVGPDLDPNCWYADGIHERIFQKVNFEKISNDKKACKITQIIDRVKVAYPYDPVHISFPYLLHQQQGSLSHHQSLQGSNRQVCVKFKDFSRTSQDFPTVFKDWKFMKNY